MKNVFLILFLLFAAVAVNAQTELGGKELRVTSGFWGYSYYVGDSKVSSKEFAEVVKQKENVYKVFKSGKNLATTGTVISTVGAFFVGYDLGARLGGGKGNTGMLLGGGAVAAGGIALALIGESKMKKAVRLFNGENTACSLQLGASPGGVSLSFNF